MEASEPVLHDHAPENTPSTPTCVAFFMAKDMGEPIACYSEAMTANCVFPVMRCMRCHHPACLQLTRSASVVYLTTSSRILLISSSESSYVFLFSSPCANRTDSASVADGSPYFLQFHHHMRSPTCLPAVHAVPLLCTTLQGAQAAAMPLTASFKIV